MAVPVRSTTATTRKSERAVRVTVDNFERAESDMYFGNVVRDAGGIGKLQHNRELFSVDNQVVIRGNRDTLYSPCVVDLEAGDVTVTLPDAGKRYRSMQVINEDQYVVGKVELNAGTYTIDKDGAGTRYATIAIRTFVNPNDAKDVAQVHALQDATRVDQKSAGTFEVPSWDDLSRRKLREALLTLAATLPDFRKAFGARDEVDPVRHLIGTAAAWGGNPDRNAIYLNVAPENNDGATVHRLTVRDVPVDAFWSISVYNARGYFEKNARNAYTLNSVTATPNTDGSFTIQFGGCDDRTANCLPIVPGWNYTVRLYEPRPEILDGSWVFPEARVVE